MGRSERQLTRRTSSDAPPMAGFSGAVKLKNLENLNYFLLLYQY